MKKKTRAKILITGYEDPVKGRMCDFGYNGKEEEVVAILFKCSVQVCREDLHMSNDQIIDLYTGCVGLSGEQHDR